MRERDYRPVYGSVTRHIPDFSHYEPPVPQIRPQEEWEQYLASEFSPAHVEDINEAEKVAASLASDMHLYRKIGSQFLGIAFAPGYGPTVKINVHEVR